MWHDQVLALLSPQGWTITWDSRPKRPFYPRNWSKGKDSVLPWSAARGPIVNWSLWDWVKMHLLSLWIYYLGYFVTGLEGWLSQNSAQLSGATKQNSAQITERPVNLQSWAVVNDLPVIPALRGWNRRIGSKLYISLGYLVSLWLSLAYRMRHCFEN